LRDKNFNFEEFHKYTAIYEEARTKDINESNNFWKLVKYVQMQHGKDEDKAKNDMLVRDFLKKYRLDLIEIPEEFKDLDGNDALPLKGRKADQRKRVLTRTDKSLLEYDVWRSFDRQMIAPTPQARACCKLMIAPALLKKAFGRPDKTEYGFAVSGQYDFEDSNLDLYRLIDYKATQFYYGLNRPDEFYYTEKNMKKPERKRVKKWPTIDEFWKSDEPKMFRLMACDHADWRKFKRWFLKHLKSIENSDFDYDEECMRLHGE